MNAHPNFAEHAVVDGFAGVRFQGTKESADRSASASPVDAAGVESSATPVTSATAVDAPGPERSTVDESGAGTGPTVVVAPEELVEPVEVGLSSIVRPYAWTAGRTASNHEFGLETLISTSDLGRWQPPSAGVEHQLIADLCRDPRSVAEVAALLSFPLGVAKVLLSDMAELGLITVHESTLDSDVDGGLQLMERVLSGLHRL